MEELLRLHAGADVQQLLDGLVPGGLQPGLVLVADGSDDLRSIAPLSLVEGVPDLEFGLASDLAVGEEPLLASECLLSGLLLCHVEAQFEAGVEVDAEIFLGVHERITFEEASTGRLPPVLADLDDGRLLFVDDEGPLLAAPLQGADQVVELAFVVANGDQVVC